MLIICLKFIINTSKWWNLRISASTFQNNLNINEQIIIVNDDCLTFNILSVNGYFIWFLRIRRSIHLLRTCQVCFVYEWHWLHNSLTQFTQLTKTKISQWNSWFSFDGLVSTATLNEHTIDESEKDGANIKLLGLVLSRNMS